MTKKPPPEIRYYFGRDDHQAAYDFFFDLMDFFDNADLYAPDLENAMNPDRPWEDFSEDDS
jgi:hypothetical protein